MAAEVPVDYVPELVADPRVGRVTYDRAVHALLDVAAPTVFAANTEGSGLVSARTAIRGSEARAL